VSVSDKLTTIIAVVRQFCRIFGKFTHIPIVLRKYRYMIGLKTENEPLFRKLFQLSIDFYLFFTAFYVNGYISINIIFSFFLDLSCTLVLVVEKMKNCVLKKCLLPFFCLLMIFLVLVPAASAEQIFTDPETGMEFVWVPGGTFQMGQTGLEKEDLVKVMGADKFDKYCACELPRHKVVVDGFWMGMFEVTNLQYRFFKPDHDSKSYDGHSLNVDNQPVVEVSCYDAIAYAEWLSSKSRRKFSLPSEAEWEYACRAGTTTVCFWGDDANFACDYANVGDQAAQKEWPVWTVHGCVDGVIVTAPVGCFKPNAFGLYDMLGNVWEWCSDWFSEGYYKESPEFNPRGLSSGIYRVARGSCWDSPPRYVRSASRNKRRPDNRSYAIGFRLVSLGTTESSLLRNPEK